MPDYKNIAELPAASSVGASDLLVISQGGVAKKATPAQLPGGSGGSAVSPTVAITKSGKVTTITITDVNGVHTATINDGMDGVSPSVSISKSGKVTTISITDATGVHTATINDGEDGAGLPEVTVADNGKFARVVGGEWAAVDLPAAEEASF